MLLMQRSQKKNNCHSLYYFAAFERGTVQQVIGTVTLDDMIETNVFKSKNWGLLFIFQNSHVSSLCLYFGQKEFCVWLFSHLGVPFLNREGVLFLTTGFVLFNNTSSFNHQNHYFLFFSHTMIIFQSNPHPSTHLFFASFCS